MGHRRCVCVPVDRAGVPALAGQRRVGLRQSDRAGAIRVLGRVVAVRPGFHAAVGARLVRLVLSRGHAHRVGQRARPGPRHSALDALGRLAVRGLCPDDDLRPAGQCLSVPAGGAGGAGRLDRGGDDRRLALWPQQARLVQVPVSGQWRVQLAGQAGALAFQGGRGKMAPSGHSRRGDQLRAAGAAAPHEGRGRLPCLWPL
ncbi:Uncharacterised protein [Bordetella pertussis]|nr:Uncharacterised protein [Bordetella pertussis]CFP04546.1 Uncharacterised protein [Bordetella pertussis]CFP06119.1 Uncharacterised protein [Bordetella pertussis]CFT90876.1 Uncharacterised protein [Bordetella pertussis]CFV99454.1 Uncharacterised protein [Bordetella pertussis]